MLSALSSAAKGSHHPFKVFVCLRVCIQCVYADNPTDAVDRLFIYDWIRKSINNVVVF